jgi:maltodextrin utilization protein YvdJ
MTARWLIWITKLSWLQNINRFERHFDDRRNLWKFGGFEMFVLSNVNFGRFISLIFVFSIASMIASQFSVAWMMRLKTIILLCSFEMTGRWLIWITKLSWLQNINRFERHFDDRRNLLKWME